METLHDIWAELGIRARRFIGKRVSDPHAADDIAQDVMLKAQARWDRLPPGDKLPAWVFAVARNAIIDHYRALAVRNHVDLDEVGPVADEREIERRETLRGLTTCLLRILEHLPEPYREALKLAEFEGLSQQEIAARTSVSLSGAKSRVQRPRQQLRKMILDCCHLERDVRGNVVDYDATKRSGRYCGHRDGKPERGR